MINDFSGGLNTRYRQNRIADNESPASRNSRFLSQNALTKRLGTTRITIPTADMANDNLGLAGAFSYRFNPQGGSDDPADDQVLIAGDTKMVRSDNVSTLYWYDNTANICKFFGFK